jgi:hypothetical protein
MYKINTLNLSNNPKVNQGFDPETITNVTWELASQSFSLITRVLNLEVHFTANNFTQSRTFTYDIPETVTTMGVPQMYGLLLSETELKDSVQV